MKSSSVSVYDSITAYSLIGYIIVIVLPYATLTNFSDRVEREADPIFVIAALTILVAAAGLHVLANGARVKICLARSAWWLLALFTVSGIASIFAVDSIKAFASSSLGISVTLLIAYVGKFALADQSKALRLGAFFYTIYIAFLMVTLSVVIGKTVGGIQPNQFAKLGIVAMAMAYIGQSRYRLLYALVAFACCAVSTSRGGIVFMAVFLGVYYIVGAKIRTALPLAGALISFVAVAWIVELVAGIPTVSLITQNLLMVDDPTYGINSGLTGRTGHWEAASYYLGDRPLFGFGFNTRGPLEATSPELINAHQGTLNLLMDNGVVGAVLFFMAVGTQIFRSLSAFRSTSDNAVPRTFLGYLLAYVVLMQIEPYYLNLSFPLSVLFIFVLVIDPKRAEVLSAPMTAASKPSVSPVSA